MFALEVLLKLKLFVDLAEVKVGGTLAGGQLDLRTSEDSYHSEGKQEKTEKTAQ